MTGPSINFIERSEPETLWDVGEQDIKTNIDKKPITKHGLILFTI
jgi:hypothetical protein